MKNILISVGIALSAISGSVALAQNVGNVTYPIAELGGCTDKDACRAYCEKKENMLVCINFGSKKGMMSQEEAKLAKKAVEKIQAGQTPGGCTDRASCTNFCENDVKNLKSCIAFAKEMGAPQSDIAEAERIASALEGGAKLPGDCKGKQACEAYCKNVKHIDECISFAEVSGIIPADQLAEAKKIAKFIKSGEMPGGCTDKASCDVYCKDDTHFAECINFADKAGLISKEDADMARKVGGKGPGDCRSKDECAVYCNATEHAAECANFAVEHGLVSAEDAEKIKGGAGQLKQALESIPEEARPQVTSCLNDVFDGKLDAILSGAQTPTKSQGDKIQGCFSVVGKIMQEKAMQGAGGQGQPGMMTSGDIQKSLEGAPADVKVQIQKQMDEARQRAMESAQSQAIPRNQSGIEIPAGVPSSMPTGVQGAPCNSPEECQAMFGGSAGSPPAGYPVSAPTGMPAGVPAGYPTNIPTGFPQY